MTQSNKMIGEAPKNFIIDPNTGLLKHTDVFRNYAGNALVTYKETLHLTNVQKQVLIGTLLGDASMATQQGNHGHYVKFEQKLGSAAYVDHLYQILKPFVGSPPRIRIIDPEGVYAKPRFSMGFRTYRHDLLKPYYDLFYPLVDKHRSVANLPVPRRIKRIPQNIGELLSPMSLAYWFMDDGSYRAGTNLNSRYTYFICTHSFNFADQMLAVHALKANFDINGALHKDKNFYKLVISAKSSLKFKSLIQPYIVCGFQYKLERGLEHKY